MRPLKSLGQNFLLDKNILDQIAETAELTDTDETLEIGAGLGSLTRILAERTGSVTAVEKDVKLIDGLTTALSDYPNITLVHADALKLDFAELMKGHYGIKVVSNLPYSVSSQILMKLFSDRDMFSMFVLMLQRELGERISAPPGGRQRGAISVLIQAYMDVRVEFRAPPRAFWPEPGVESVVLKFVPLAVGKIPEQYDKSFTKVVKAAFSTRRKMLSNSLQSAFDKDDAKIVIDAAGIERSRRAETLSVEEFLALAKAAERLSE